MPMFCTVLKPACSLGEVGHSTNVGKPWLAEHLIQSRLCAKTQAEVQTKYNNAEPMSFR